MSEFPRISAVTNGDLEEAGCVVVLAVRSEPLGNLQGILVEIGYSGCIDGPQVAAITELSDPIPYALEQGILFGERGVDSPEQGT